MHGLEIYGECSGQRDLPQQLNKLLPHAARCTPHCRRGITNYMVLVEALMQLGNFIGANNRERQRERVEERGQEKEKGWRELGANRNRVQAGNLLEH